jgi:hypothetical protein
LANEAIAAADLANIEVSIRDNRPGAPKLDLTPRTLSIDAEAFNDLVDASAARGVSINSLIDAAIRLHFETKPSPRI